MVSGGKGGWGTLIASIPCPSALPHPTHREPARVCQDTSFRETGLHRPLWPYCSIRRPFPVPHRTEGGPGLLACSVPATFLCGHVQVCVLWSKPVRWVQVDEHPIDSCA